jgi:hypothetical protein
VAPTPTPTPLPVNFPVPVQVEFDPSITDWLGVLVALVGAVATIIIGLLAYRVSRQATHIQAQMRDDGIAAATAQARAANAQVEATTVLAEVLNRNDELLRDLRAGLGQPLAKVGNGASVTLSDLTAPRPLVNWNVVKGARSRWEIRNVGSTTAFGVSIRAENESDQNELTPIFEGDMVVDISPGNSYPFLWGRTFASPAALVIVVSWHEDGDQPFTTRLVVA